MRRYQLGWFSTAKGKGSRGLLQTVLDSIEAGNIDAEIAFVFCSREPGESAETDIFLKMVEDYRLPLVTHSYRKFKSRHSITDIANPDDLPSWRLEYDREVMARLKDFRPDLCVLAGYMLVTGREMCQRYNMINLHPAAPGGPAGTWQEVIWQLMTARRNETGVMMHLVTPELDEGTVVTYCTFPIKGEPFDAHWQELDKRGFAEIKQSQGVNNRLFQLIRQRGYLRELPLVVATIKAFSQGRVRITPDKRVVDAGGNPSNGYDLTEEIDKMIKGKLP